MRQEQADLARRHAAVEALQNVELRHLRYFVALADAGSFTRAAEQIFITQPTLSQQIRRLEEIVGTPLLERQRDGLRLTPAGRVLLEAARSVLSLVDHELAHARQAAGLGRQRLRMVISPYLPETFAAEAAATLGAAATATDADVAWLETGLDAEFSLIRTRQADAGLGWLTDTPDTLPAPLDAMILGEFEPEVWIPAGHAATSHGSISLDELAAMAVIHGPRYTRAPTREAWGRVLRAANPRFAFIDPPFRHSLPMTLALAAASDRPTAVVTTPSTIAGGWARPVRQSAAAATSGMVRVGLQHHPLTAAAALVWTADLPRPLQQMLFDVADTLSVPAPQRRVQLVS